MPKFAVLLVNLGTPDKPVKSAVKAYLKEFLMDEQVITLPFVLRYLLVNAIIIPKRLTSVTGLYQQLWQQDSPIRTILFEQVEVLREELAAVSDMEFLVLPAMTYGQPSILQALKKIQQERVDGLIVFPLYPQYSRTTTIPVFKRVEAALRDLKMQMPVHYIEDYHQSSGYIAALAQQIRTRWQQQQKPQVLVLSFHGIPLSYAKAGDPYLDQCHKTAELLSAALSSEGVPIQIAFQSRVTSEEWAKPYTESLVQDLARQGLKSIEINCPGFSADCLETLHEIAVEYRDLFLEAGGESYHCYPALNASSLHIHTLGQLVLSKLKVKGPDFRETL